jgi:hypothetical protein
MKKAARISAALLTAGALSLSSRSVSANEPVTAETLQGGLGIRYGFELEPETYNSWAVGIGAKAGYTFSNAVYAGAIFDYFFGDEVVTGISRTDHRAWQGMLEGGYDIAAGSLVVVRPQLAVGMASIIAEACPYGGNCEDRTQTSWAMAPGAEVMLVTHHFALSLDVRYDLIFEDRRIANTLILGAGVGVAF